MTVLAMEHVRFEVDGPDGHVGRLTLDRPDKLNSFTAEMWRDLRDLGAHLLADPGALRALIVTGAGRAFSSGIDTSVLVAGFGDGPPTGAHAHEDPVVDMIMTTQDAYTWLEDAPFATIAAVRGYALGAGLQLALACDIRIVAEGTQLGLLELQYGIMPDLGGTQRLPRLVGAGKAKELIFSGATLDAHDAGRLGIAEHVVPEAELDRVAGDLATRIASQPPLAVQGAKRAVRAALELPLKDGLRFEAEQQAICLGSDDLREAMAAFVEQRPPRYQGR